MPVFSLGGGRGRDEFVCCKDMGVRDVAYVSPVEEVGVVSDLEVRLATLVDLVNPVHELTVTRSIQIQVGYLIQIYLINKKY